MVGSSRSMLIKKAESIVAEAKFDGRKEVSLDRFLSRTVLGLGEVHVPAGVAGLVHLHGAVRGGALHRPQHPAHRHRCQDLQRWHSSPLQCTHHCTAAGLPPFIDEAHKKKMMRNNLRRLVTIFVVIIFVWTSQSRVTRYRWLLATSKIYDEWHAIPNRTVWTDLNNNIKLDKYSTLYSNL